MSEVFKKVAENNVRVFERKPVTDIDGVEHFVHEYKHSYGQQGIDTHKSQADEALRQANAFDAQAHKDSEIARLESTIQKKTLALGLFETVQIPDENGNMIEILNPEDVEKYAQVGVSAEAIEEAKVQLVKANEIDPVAMKQELIDTAQSAVNRMAEIQAEMDKVL